MATGIAPVSTQPTRNSSLLTWTAITTGADGDPVSIGEQCTSMTVHIDGTFGSGSKIAINGSNRSTGTYNNLSANTATGLTLSAITQGMIVALNELPLYIKVSYTGTGGTATDTSINVQVLARF